MLRAHEAAARAVIRLIKERPEVSIEEVAAQIGPAAQSGFAPTISGVAEEIARLWADYCVLDAGETQRHQLLEANPNARCANFERLKDTAHAHLRVLEQVLLQLEPQGDGELLSLLLVTEDLFQRWAADAYGAEQPLTNDAEREWGALSLAFAAMTRWLLSSGAKSPLVKTYFRPDRREPLSQQMADEVKRAGLIMIPEGERS